MKVFRNALQAGRWVSRCVLAIGKFDGMHVGHRALLGLALERARALKSRCAVLTFDPLPEQFLGEGRPLFPLAKRLRVLRELGLDAAVLLPFNEALACMAPEAFAKDVVAGQLRARSVYVGEDFCFGKDRAGSPTTLEELGPELGFEVHSVPLVRVAGEKVTSAGIRRLLDEGRLSQAKRLLSP